MLILSSTKWDNLHESSVCAGRCKMVDLLVSLGKLAIGFLGIVGPLALLLLFLHVRDQRESMLVTTVLAELNLPHLRGLSTVKVRSWPLWADMVVVDLWNCSRDQVWDVMETVANKLPPRVRLEVNGITDCRVRSTWKLTVMRTHPFVGYCPL
jgi:hypothetical protein